MSIATVVTRGYGSFGSIGAVVLLGYGAGTEGTAFAGAGSDAWDHFNTVGWEDARRAKLDRDREEIGVRSRPEPEREPADEEPVEIVDLSGEAGETTRARDAALETAAAIGRRVDELTAGFAAERAESERQARLRQDDEDILLMLAALEG